MLATPRNEESIFAQALEQPSAAERAAFLDAACGNDAMRRARIDKLLQRHEESDGFLAKPFFEATPTTDTPALTDGPGTRIGPYKLLQQLGEGGMGVVYMAEQEQPLRRRVALKIIKPGMDSAQVSARFEVERQALALMDHQNIARVLDAGTTDSGRPYFVMELVHGVPITQYCDTNKLSPRQRLELFIPVCQAIQHAHQKGIIHRDLKPSNVMVTLHDGQPVPKVIDFGVAKATEQRLTERTLFTLYGTIVGTLEYMAPEQAEMSGLGVDTRSDIYALGVLLYELLTGTTPLERGRLREAAYDEMLRLIREEEPPRPSRRISTSGDRLATISAERNTEPAQLSRLVHGELDWIVMRCLEKDRTRRYEAASSLARDIQRYLADEPVEACPPSAGYKLHKFARKNKKLLTTAAAFAALLLLGVTASTWQAVRATQAEGVANANAVQAQEKEQEANEQRDEAQQQRDEARALAEKLRRVTYTAHINLAQHAWETAAIPRMLDLLERHRPKPGEPDLRNFEWHYLQRLCQGDQLLTMNRFDESINSVVFSPDGKRLASAGGPSGGPGGKIYDSELKVWDAQTGQELWVLKGGAGSVASVAFSPDGKRLASGITIWDDTKKAWVTMGVKVCNAQSGEELFSYKGHAGDVISVAFSPDGKRVASASGGRRSEGKPGEVKVWDAQTGQELLSLQGGNGDVRGVAFSPDGKRLAQGFGGGLKDGKRIPGVVKVWDAQTGQELLSLEGGGDSLAFSPDGKLLASKSGGERVGSTRVPEEVKVWVAQTGQEIPGLHEHSDGSLVFVFSPDGKRLAIAGQQSRMPRIKVCDTTTGREIFTLFGHTASVSSLAFSPDGKRLASGSGDRTVRLWDLQTGQEIRTLAGHGQSVRSVAFSPDGNRLASAYNYMVKVWDVQKAPETLDLKGDHIAAISPDFRHVASASTDNSVKVWDAHSGQEIVIFKGHTNTVQGLAFSPDGKRVASGEGAGRGAKPVPGLVKVWDAQTGQELLSLKGHKTGVWSVAFSPDGKRLASDGGGELKLWDAQTGQELFTLKSSGGPASNVAFSPDGKRLATGGSRPGGGGSVTVWDAQTGQELFVRQDDGGGSVAFSPDGRRLATASLDGTVRVWDAQTGQELVAIKDGHLDFIWCVAFSPDGRRLATASRDGTVKVWDAQTGEELLLLKGHTGSVDRVVFSADGHRLAGAFWNGTVKFWDATPLPEK
jgi:WD40 repeat protein/serine/threonine protein kinase